MQETSVIKATAKTMVQFQWATWCYIPEEKPLQRQPSQVSTQNETPFILYLFPFKKKFHMKFTI
jgi:hypothetical protein